jgi:hypothetical protein
MSAKHGLPVSTSTDVAECYGGCTARLAVVVRAEMANFAGLRCADGPVDL